MAQCESMFHYKDGKLVGFESCPHCTDGFIPNADPWAMIPACVAKEWQVGFSEDNVWILDATDEPIFSFFDHAEQIPAALTDAMFQATLPLAKNWGECQCGFNYRKAGLCITVECLDRVGCRGTGKVLTGAGETV